MERHFDFVSFFLCNSFVIPYTVRAETLCCLLSCQLPFEMQLTPFLLSVNTMAPFCPKPVVLLV